MGNLLTDPLTAGTYACGKTGQYVPFLVNVHLTWLFCCHVDPPKSCIYHEEKSLKQWAIRGWHSKTHRKTIHGEWMEGGVSVGVVVVVSHFDSRIRRWGLNKTNIPCISSMCINFGKSSCIALPALSMCSISFYTVKNRMRKKIMSGLPAVLLNFYLEHSLWVVLSPTVSVSWLPQSTRKWTPVTSILK